MSEERKWTILKLIIQDFVETAQPVASNYLIKKYDLKWSSATIRNEMVKLENEGFIEKTHTSSGRVPSTKAYQYYIDNLKTEDDIDPDFKSNLNELFVRKSTDNNSIEDILKESCAMLAHMTNLASVVLGPDAQSEKLINIQVIPLNANTCTTIFVTDRGYVENKTFVLSKENTMEEVTQCMEILDKRLKGTRIIDLTDKLNSMKPILQEYLNDYASIYDALLKIFVEFSANRGQIIGKENLYNQPEFSNDSEKLKKVFGLINNPIKIEELIKESNDQTLDNVSSEDVTSANEDLSIVSKDIIFPEGEVNLGKIAVIGPKRMDYVKVLNYLDYLVKQIIVQLHKPREQLIAEKKAYEEKHPEVKEGDKE